MIPSDFDTLAVRAGTARSQFNEHSEALYLTSSFVFDNAAQALLQSDRDDDAGPSRGARRG
jgi:O-succinylhomoserine sulfhydrylase